MSKILNELNELNKICKEKYIKKVKKIENNKKENIKEKCLCKKSHQEIDEYYLMSINEFKGTLQIFKNKNGIFGMLFTEISINYCPRCGRKLGDDIDE